jgi:hypothetical protein
MTTTSDLLEELRTLLQAGAISYNSATAASDVYEGFLFALVIATARDSNADVYFENVRGTRVDDLIFRTTPGRLYSTAHDYTHAVIQFGPRAPGLEAHVGVLVQGNSGVEHECDVLVLEADEARVCRQVRASPRTRKCLLAIECKYYLANLPLGVARGFAGLKDDLGQTHTIFAANANSRSVKKYLSHRKLTQEFGAIPGSRETEHLRTHIREAFKAYVSRHDPGFGI